MSEPVAALRSIRSAWDEATRDGGQACGLDVAVEAYAAMRAAWFDELGALLAMLERSDAGG